jgi:hypothetical protein
LEHQPDRALRLIGAAAALREAIGAPLSAAERAKLDRLLEPVRQALSPAEQAAAESAGKVLPPDEALEYALA